MGTSGEKVLTEHVLSAHRAACGDPHAAGWPGQG